MSDARKVINRYKNNKVKVPILGLVENLAGFTLPNFRKTNIIFSARKVQRDLLKSLMFLCWARFLSYRVYVKEETMVPLLLLMRIL